MIEWKNSKWSKKHSDIIYRPYEDFKFITLMGGSVSSGKTVTQIVKSTIDLIPQRADVGKILISGNSKETVYNNFLVELFNLIGHKNYHYDASNGRLIIKSKVLGTKNDAFIRVSGASKQGNENNIWGDTFALWIADELTLHTRKFFNLALTRLRLPNSKVFATTNPADIFHYLYREYINEPKKAKIFEYLFFCLDDNLNLPPEYVENIKQSFSGVFYLRMIDGQWCIAEGLVVPEYNPDKHKLSRQQIEENQHKGLYKEFIGGCDWGYSNEMAAGVWGVTRENKFHLIREFYKTKQLTEDVAKWFLDQEKILGKKLNYIFCDSAEPDRIQELVNKNLNAYLSEKAIGAGLNTIKSGFKNDQICICEDCKNTENELLTLRWPEEGEPGYGDETKFIGKDHAMDGVLRYPIHSYKKDVIGLR
jgi:PBSX family phage terminase large subunit